MINCYILGYVKIFAQISKINLQMGNAIPDLNLKTGISGFNILNFQIYAEILKLQLHFSLVLFSFFFSFSTFNKNVTIFQMKFSLPPSLSDTLFIHPIFIQLFSRKERRCSFNFFYIFYFFGSSDFIKNLIEHSFQGRENQKV